MANLKLSVALWTQFGLNGLLSGMVNGKICSFPALKVHLAPVDDFNDAGINTSQSQLGIWEL